jgi:superfamily II DNA or RNA helicase
MEPYQLLHEAYQQTGAQKDGTSTGKQVVVIVGTYECIAMLLAKADEPIANWQTWNNSFIRDRLRMLIFDEAHHIQAGKTRYLTVYVLARYLDLCMITLTATGTPELANYTGPQFLPLVEQRVHPRIVFSFPTLSEDTILVKEAVQYGFLGWIQALTSGRTRRTAILIENKMLLKITTCLLAYEIYSRTRNYTDALQIIEKTSYVVLFNIQQILLLHVTNSNMGKWLMKLMIYHFVKPTLILLSEEYFL